MKIITVIPLKKSVWRDDLSYFTNRDVLTGAIVTVPIRKQQIDGLVVDSREASDLKSELKTSDWQLRKLTSVKKAGFFEPVFVATTRAVADYFSAPIGAVLKSAVPQIILDNLLDLKIPNSPTKVEKTLFEILAIQEMESERLTRYKSLIRESFAKKQSVFLCLPTIATIEKILPLINRGIENYTLVGHSQLTKTEQLNFWRQALNVKHPVLIIATPTFLSLPRMDISTIIIEQESSSTYKQISRPFLDWRFLAEELARQKKIRLILGDTTLRSETIYRLGRNEISSLGATKYRLTTNIISQIIPLQTKSDRPKAISERLLEQIEDAIDRKERFFIFSGRRGLASLTVCRDCGTAMTCDVCQSPLAIHQINHNRIFICHKCGQIIEIEDKCRVCAGQRLAIIGFGVEKIAEEISQAFPQAKVFKLNSDEAKTNQKANAIIKQFSKTPGSILIGTELALHHLSEPIARIAVVEVDSFFARPDWRAGEKLFHLLARLKSLAGKQFIIQTRLTAQTDQPEEKIFTEIVSGNLIDFYREEIADRRELGYPPFKVLIKISLAGELTIIKKEMRNLKKILSDWQPLIYPSLTKNNKGQSGFNLLLRLPAGKWPDQELLKILKNLPPSFIINVDPENVL